MKITLDLDSCFGADAKIYFGSALDASFGAGISYFDADAGIGCFNFGS